jgi:hypothetical protein
LCGATAHEASIQIWTQGKADFLAGTATRFDADRWPDAFSCFNMAITCTGCGKRTPVWVSHETM